MIPHFFSTDSWSSAPGPLVLHQNQWQTSMKRSIVKGRKYITTNTVFINALSACRVSVAITALLQFPAFLASCTQEQIQVRIDKAPHLYSYGSVDVFVFCNEAPYLLDSYQQFPSTDAPVYVSSGQGSKIIAALSAKEGDLYARAGVRTYQDLCRVSFPLLEDSPSAPCFYGTVTVGEGSSRSAAMEVSPLISSIRVRSVSCDFGGRPYEEHGFHNDRLYLVNVVSEFCPLQAEGGRPVSWLNYGAMTDDHPYIAAPGYGDIGRERVYPDMVLFCYPNPRGSPPTRLVLEGTVGPERCFYPINIDVPRGGMAVNLDITLHRMGTRDPDSPAAPGTYTVEYSTVPWNEKEAVVEDF